MRVIPDIDVERAQARTTVTYALLPSLSVGLEFNPVANDLGPLANWRVWDEEENRPALIVGTSSDRIGTESGRAFFATLSKDLEGLTGLPIAPYAGASYGEFDHETVAIGGLFVRWAERWSSTHLFDGHNLHHVLSHAYEEGPVVGLVVVELDGVYSVGLTVGTSFAAGSGANGETAPVSDG